MLGEALLKPLKRSPVATYGFFALTRLGARVLLYGPLNAVVHHQVAETWLDNILSFEPGHESERLAWAFCLTQLARKTYCGLTPPSPRRRCAPRTACGRPHCAR